MVSHSEALNIKVSINHEFEGAGKENFKLHMSLAIPNTGITALFGPSGSGKTSILRAIAGLEHFTNAEVVVNGAVWQSDKTFVPTYKRPLGYVFQESSLFEHLSAEGNLAFARKRAANTDSLDHYERVISTLGIEKILSRFPKALSGGERQRVAIARSLLIQPELLLMDEPLASLDAARKGELIPYLAEIQKTFNIPIIYVSHAMDEIARLADYAVSINEGAIQAQGPLDDVLTALELPFNKNENASVVIKGQITEIDTQWQLAKVQFDDGYLWAPASMVENKEEARVQVFAKDVSIALRNIDDVSIINRLHSEIVEIYQEPGRGFAMLKLKAGSSYILSRVTTRSVSELQLKAGVNVWAQIKSVAILA